MPAPPSPDQTQSHTSRHDLRAYLLRFPAVVLVPRTVAIPSAIPPVATTGKWDPLSSAGFNQCMNSVACFSSGFCSVGLQAADRITHTDQKRLLPFVCPTARWGPPFILLSRDSERILHSRPEGGRWHHTHRPKPTDPLCLPVFRWASPCLSRHEKACRNLTK